MALICVTGPAVEPVTLAEARDHMRVDITDDDVLIAGLITAAREHLETICRPQLAMITQTWRYVADGWPASDTLELRPWPLQSVTSVAYTSDAGVTATFASSNYVVDTYSKPGRLRLKSTASWPGTTLQVLNGLVVEFVAGYGNTSAAVPQRLRQALLLLAAHWYENRELAVLTGAMPKQLPFSVDALMQHWRREVA
jgi:uncharacterized phiE125 gp8 family phage protein